MGSLDGLIDVQTLDTRADQVRHRRDHLPQAEAVAEARRDRDAADARAETARGRLRELVKREKALEDEAALVEDKAAEIDRKLYDGSVVAHKELEAFQADHRLLKARQSELEDEAIEIMEAARAAGKDGQRRDINSTFTPATFWESEDEAVAAHLRHDTSSE